MNKKQWVMSKYASLQSAAQKTESLIKQFIWFWQLLSVGIIVVANFIAANPVWIDSWRVYPRLANPLNPVFFNQTPRALIARNKPNVIWLPIDLVVKSSLVKLVPWAILKSWVNISSTFLAGLNVMQDVYSAI